MNKISELILNSLDVDSQNYLYKKYLNKMVF